MRRFLLRLYALFRPGHADRQLEREMSSHLGLLEDQFRARGMTPEEARIAARRAFGGHGSVDRTKESHREARAFRWLEDARRDVLYAIRAFARTPGFTCLALLTLALGIGFVTSIYSVIHNVLLDPLPYPNSERFVNVAVQDAATGRSRGAVSVDEFIAYRDQSTVFEEVVGTFGEGMVLTASERAEFIRAVWVTPNFFNFMGLPPLLGRTITPDDARPGAPAVAVLRHRAWAAFFGSDPNVIGRVVSLNGEPRVVVGVMPPRFTWHAADIWIPGPLDSGRPGMFRNFQARLRPGGTVEQAEMQLTTIAARRAREYPQDYPANVRMRVVYVIDAVVGDFRGVLYTLMAAVGLLMLIACCNVANMLLARAMAREREITVRAALGAGRGRIIRQLLVESLLLSTGGAAAGCLLAYGAIKALKPWLPQGPLPGEIEIALDGPALMISLGTAIVSALLFGIAPAFFGVRHDLVNGLKNASRNVTSGRGRLRSALVVAEIALAVVLMLSAGLLLRSFLSLTKAELGFNPWGLVVVRPTFPAGTHGTPPEVRHFFRQWLERIAALPGVERAAVTSNLPPFGGYRASVLIPDAKAVEPATTLVQYCTDDYFQTLGVRVSGGQGLAEDGRDVPRPVAMVNRAFVTTYFGGVDPIGRQFRLALSGRPGESAQPSLLEIVGVVDDIRNQGIRDVSVPEVYLPGIAAGSTPVVIVRTTANSARMLNAIRHDLDQLDPRIGLRLATTVEQLVERSSYAQPRFSMIVMFVFSCAAMLLVGIGIYSVMAYTVSQQAQEIAVRMALGAGRLQVCGTVLTWGGMLVAAGVASGLCASVATNRLIASQLWNTSSQDPLTIVVTTAIITLLALAACYVPTRRAMSVEPMVALRRD
jgi:putative ABC transport system permease protein